MAVDSLAICAAAESPRSSVDPLAERLVIGVPVAETSVDAMALEEPFAEALAAFWSRNQLQLACESPRTYLFCQSLLL